MGQEAQLANYFTAAVVSWGLFVALAALLWVTRRTDALTKNARVAVFGLLLVPLHWGIHQTWWGIRWYFRIVGDERTQFFLLYGGSLAVSYALMFVGVAVTTTALIRGRFLRTLSIKLTVVGVLWVTVYLLTVWGGSGSRLPG